MVESLGAHLGFVLVALIASMVVVILTGATMAFANRGSQTIGLGFAALLAAVTAFSGQLFFQLRPAPMSVESVATQVLIEPLRKRIIPYPDADAPGAEMVAGSVQRFIVERDAGAMVASRNPNAFNDEQKLLSDLLVFSFLNYVFSLEPDWRVKISTYEYPSMPGRMTFSQMSDPRSSTEITLSSIQWQLQTAGNLFADVPMAVIHQSLRLPRRSSVTVAEGEVVVASPTITIRFAVETYASMINGLPKRVPAPLGSGIEITNNNGQFHLYLCRMSLVSTVARLHAQDLEMDVYREWFARMVSGAREWFKPMGSNL